ncbi:MAG TPA: 50S ribosomal protein L29 [Bacteroidales bacterium]|mgnify:CR=1 FL=1|jgi:large subunit ribosomal protein L29|nr:50S ribosomal protein L29 [Bacteroidales bacterium]HOF15581.1 50S ribosomal protein L29 [Bacteroidales bacterium]HON20297.1 50S ribosomal protein L29 [Bacteroidales bacterium]HOR81426.1 50S ribosomal protein L29 [Bacteroidales bacterium]HPJ90601.1 50S ribosomal protein L29 [Bacteroidales bacterium]
MKQAVISEFSTKELYERLEAENLQLTKLKLHHAVSSIENPNKIKEYRKTIARLKTEIRNRELAEQKSQK